MIYTVVRRPHRRKIRLFDLDFRLRFHGRHRADHNETLRKAANHIGQRFIPVRFNGCLDLGCRLRLRAFFVAQVSLCPGARRDIDIVADNRVSGLTALTHFDLGIRTVADIPIPQIRLSRRVDRHIAGVFAVFPFRRDCRIVCINARDTHRRAHRRHFDVSCFFVSGRRIDVRVLNDKIAAILRRFRGIRLQFSFRHSDRQCDISAAGCDRRTGHREILLRLRRDVPPGRE